MLAWISQNFVFITYANQKLFVKNLWGVGLTPPPPPPPLKLGNWRVNACTFLLPWLPKKWPFITNYDCSTNVSVNSNWVLPPRRMFFEQANPNHPGSFCLIPLPQGQKWWSDSPEVGQNFSQDRRNCSLSLQKILKKLRKLRDSSNYLSGELNKAFIF